MSYIAAESPWLNARFNLGATRAARLYFATTVTTVTVPLRPYEHQDE